MMTNDDICAAVRAARDRATDGAVKSASFVYDGLVREAEDMDSAPRDRIRALELVGKLRGEFVTKVETQTTVTHALQYTPDQLARLEAIMTEPIEGTARILDEGTQ